MRQAGQGPGERVAAVVQHAVLVEDEAVVVAGEPLERAELGADGGHGKNSKERIEDPKIEAFEPVKRRRMPSLSLIAVASSRFVLDVLGGSGAVWGVSELLGVRGGPNNDLWRVVCCVVFLLFLLRWVVDVFRAGASNGSLSGPGRRSPNASTVRRVLDHAHTFHLQVVGGAGALWGGLEIAGFRVNYPTNCHDKTAFPAGVGAAWAPGFDECAGTYPVCRVVCGVGFVWFLVRWIAIRVCLARRRPGGAERGSGRRGRGEGEGAGCVGEGGNADAASAGEKPCSSRHKGCARSEGERHHRNGRGCCSLSRLSAAATPLLELLSTFVLDCVGAAGAVWGVAEVAGHSGASLRLGWGDRMFGQPSFDLWRLICSMVFVLFTARWVVVAGLHRRATTGGGGDGGGGGTARVSAKLVANGMCKGKSTGGAGGRMAEARADSTTPLASAWLHLPGQPAGPFCNSTDVSGSSSDAVSGEAGDASDVVVVLVVQCAPATTASEAVLSLGGDGTTSMGLGFTHQKT